MPETEHGAVLTDEDKQIWLTRLPEICSFFLKTYETYREYVVSHGDSEYLTYFE